MSAALWWFWYLRGYHTDGRQRLTRLLAVTSGGARTVSRAAALDGAGAMAVQQADLVAGQRLLGEGLAIRREVGNHRDTAWSLNHLAYAAYQRGDYRTAITRCEESLAHCRQVAGRAWETIWALIIRAGSALFQGDVAAARRYAPEALAFAEELGDRQGIAYALLVVGFSEITRGNHRDARPPLTRSLELLTRVGDRWAMPLAIFGLAGVAAVGGGKRRALHIASTAVVERMAIGAPHPAPEQSLLDAMLAPAYEALGEAAGAAAWAEGEQLSLDEAVERARELFAPESPAVSVGHLPAPSLQTGPGLLIDGHYRLR